MLTTIMPHGDDPETLIYFCKASSSSTLRCNEKLYWIIVEYILEQRYINGSQTITRNNWNACSMGERFIIG